MSDRELLELAAKAIGLDTGHSMNAERMALDPPVTSLLVTRRGELVSTAWNPLKDDGQALRLALSLRLTIKPDVAPRALVITPCDFGRREIGNSSESDLAANVRRAIVRAAAEIGRAMP